MNNKGTIHGNNKPQTNLESLRLDRISICDQYLGDLKARIKREQEFHERIQNDLTSEDRSDGWKALADAKKFLAVLLERRMLIASSKTPEELRKYYSSFRRHISITHKKSEQPESLFEEMWDLVSKHSSIEFKSR